MLGFGDSTIVMMSNNKTKPISEVQAGDVVLYGATVRCVVKFDLAAPTLLFRIGDMLITESYPLVYSHDRLTSSVDKVATTVINKWEYLSESFLSDNNIVSTSYTDVSSLYNIVLETPYVNDHLLQLSVSPNYITVCSMAHVFDELSNSYFGKAIAGKPHILDDLRSCKGWKYGYIVCKNTSDVRNDAGDFIKLTFEEA